MANKKKQTDDEAVAKENLSTCLNGHTYYKTSDCPVCPVCEMARRQTKDFLSLLGAPAIRALESKKIYTLQQLSEYSEKEILQLHGMGPAAISKLKNALQTAGLSFKNDLKHCYH
jgi:predicted RecB family nuclease